MLRTLVDEQTIPTTPDSTMNIDVEALAGSLHDAIVRSVFPTQAKESAFDVALSRCVRGNVGSIVDIAFGRMSLDDSDPRNALAFAGMVAELGIPFATLERAYWVGVERFWQEWLGLSRTILEEGRGTLGDLLGDPTAAVFPYVMRVLDLVGDRYSAVAEERARSGDDRKRALIEELLGGAVSRHTQDLDNVLGYRTRSTHVAVLFGGGDRAVVQRKLVRLCQQTGAWSSLFVQRNASTWSAWLGFPKVGDGISALRKALEDLNEPVAVGGPAHGLAGIRQSHEEACRAAELRSALLSPPDCLWYRDVRLEAFLLDDPRAARRFVTEELGELADDDERSHRIRETLLASLGSGSQAKAAAELGVHENTVRLRLRSAIEVLGDTLSERRTELLVALRLRQALGAADHAEPVKTGLAG